MHTYRINSIKRFCLLLLAASALPNSEAIEAYSETFVATAVTVPGLSVGSINYSIVSVPTVQPAVACGKISSVDSYSFTDANADWASGTVGSGYYVEFPSGLTADISSMDNSTKTINVSAYLTGNVSVGQTYKIRKHYTISEIFGAQNQTGLLGGLNVNAGDNVILYDGSSQVTKTCYFYNKPGYEAWKSGLSSVGGEIIRPGLGIIMGRRASGDKVIYTIGALKSTPTHRTIYPGWNLVGTIKAGLSLSLLGSGLYTGNADTGLTAGLNVNSSDYLLVIRADGSSVTYYYKSGTGWRTGLTDASNVAIAPGSAIFIKRMSTKPSFNWIIPGE